MSKGHAESAAGPLPDGHPPPDVYATATSTAGILACRANRQTAKVDGHGLVFRVTAKFAAARIHRAARAMLNSNAAASGRGGRVAQGKESAADMKAQRPVEEPGPLRKGNRHGPERQFNRKLRGRYGKMPGA